MIMSSASWRPLDRVDAARLRAARLQSHHAVQWLARAARAYIPARPDDSHTNVGWDDAFGGLMTHPLPDGARLGLKIAELTLVLSAARGHPMETMPLDGHRDPEVRTWLGELLSARGFDQHALDASPPYALP